MGTTLTYYVECCYNKFDTHDYASILKINLPKGTQKLTTGQLSTVVFRYLNDVVYATSFKMHDVVCDGKTLTFNMYEPEGDLTEYFVVRVVMDVEECELHLNT